MALPLITNIGSRGRRRRYLMGAAERLGEIRVEEPRHLVEVAVPGRIYTRGNRPGKRKEQVMSVKLFVGGLSFSTSSEGLRGAFARFGEVMSAAVMTDRETGRSRGFFFEEMATTEEAEKAISSLNGTSLDGRMIRVDK